MSWRGQKRRVRERAGRLRRRATAERHQRISLLRWTRAYATRVESLFWIGATGALWMHRRQQTRPDERHNPLVGVALAAWGVHRWRRLPQRLQKTLEQARAASDHAT